ncbi:MAG: helix-turn-helix domain-containing protein [Alphaproteobacteria bacterium]
MNPLCVFRSDALLDPRLQRHPAAIVTLAAISTFTTRSKDGYCYFKQETIANHMNKSRQAVSRDIKKLAELGYVEVIPQKYRGMKSNNAYRIKYDGPIDYDATSRCDDATSRCTTTQHDVATKCSSINANIYIPLSRDEFLREVDQGMKDGLFKPDFEHLTETEIVSAACDFWDFATTELIEPKQSSACAHVRRYLRKGMRSGAVRKAPKTSKGSDEAILQQDMPEWKQEALSQGIFESGEFKSWIEPLEWNGNGKLYAPTKFHAKTVEERYRPQIERALHSKITITVKSEEGQK